MRIFLAIIMLTASVAFTQVNAATLQTQVTDDEEVFESVEVSPSFPGGEQELMKYICMNINYPKEIQDMDIQGRVVLQFVVTKSGEIGDVRILRSVHPALDAEAVRVIKTLPKFTPGQMNGHPVNVWYVMPITFKLQGK